METAKTQAVILIDHGSRKPEANSVLEEVAARLQARMPGVLVLASHMELAAPTLGQAFSAAVSAGATDITVHPYFLVPGRHSEGDIPAMARAAAKMHPHVTWRLTPCLGVDDRLVDLVQDRILSSRNPGPSDPEKEG